MELLSVIALVSFFIVCSFVLGAMIGQKVVRGQDIELPRIEPLKTVQEWNKAKEIKKEEERTKIIAENIDSYNGTPYGQQEIPK